MAPTVLTTELERELDAALLTMLHENSELKGENAKLQARLDALMTAFDGNGALGVLQRIMHDEDIKTELRIKAAGLAVNFERPRPASQANVSFKLFDYLENDRLKKMAAADAAKVIEHVEPAVTVLGSDPEPAA